MLPELPPSLAAVREEFIERVDERRGLVVGVYVWLVAACVAVCGNVEVVEVPGEWRGYCGPGVFEGVRVEF